ncbi:MAG TPA: cytochrome c [Deinococcales bacterium]|nr:cytochrome c [Deinococcales bacterium]
MTKKLFAALGAAAAVTGGAAVFADSPEDASSVWDGVYTEEQAQRGQEAYEASCMSCHGNTLRGTPGAPGIAGGRFTFNWKDESVGELHSYVRGNMPVGQAGSLGSETYADIIAYILEVNEYPAGDAELSKDPEDNEGILITSSPD